MSHREGEQDPLLRLADELYELGGRLADVANALLVRAATRAPAVTEIPAAPPEPEPAPVFEPEPEPAPVLEPEPEFEPEPTPWFEPEPVAVPIAAPDPGPASRLPPVDRNHAIPWDRWGSRSLAWIGGAVTLLGLVLLLVLAIQRGWLGPVPRLLCGLGTAAVLLATGYRVHRTPSGLIGAFALTATGITALYLDVVASTALYHYVPVPAGLLAGLAVAVAGLLLASRWDSPALAIFVVLAAAACAPIITSGVTPLLVAFLLVLAGAATPVQVRRGWRYLAMAADAPPLIASLVLDRLTVGATGSTVTGTAVVAMGTVLVYLSLAVLTVLRRADDPVALGLLVAAPTPVMAAAPLLPRPFAVAALAAVSAPLFAIWAVNRRRTRPLPARFAAVAGGAGTVILFQATATATADDAAMLAITLLCQAILLAVTAHRVRGPGALVAAASYGACGTIVALARPVRPAMLIIAPLDRLDTSMLRGAVVTAALLLLAALAVAAAVARLAKGVLAIWWVLGAVGLYGFSGTVLGASMLVVPDVRGFLVGHVLVTVGWALCALVLLAKGIEALPARMAGLALVAAALVKLITFDLATLDGVTRVVAFLCSGLVLLAAGVRYARAVVTWRGRQDNSPAGPAGGECDQ